MKKLVIFDMDGTILDTLSDLAASLNAALSLHGLPLRSVDETRRFVGNGIAKLIERAVPVDTAPGKTAAVLADFKEHYRRHAADTTKPYEGIGSLLFALRSGGIRTAVVSNKADFAVQELARTYFEGLFDFVLGEKAEIAKKPAPDMVSATLRALHTAPSEAVYIGDSEVDVETARNAGLDGIFVTWGFRDIPTLLAAGGEVFAHSVEELAALLGVRLT